MGPHLEISENWEKPGWVLDCWWGHANSTTNTASSKHKAAIAATPKSTQLKTEVWRPWHPSHYPSVGEKILIKGDSTKEKHTLKGMPRLPPLAVLGGPCNAAQKWRPSWCSPSSLWSTGLSKYLLIRLSSAWLSPKEGGSESFLKDEKALSQCSILHVCIYKRKVSIAQSLFLVAKCFSNYLYLLRTASNPLAIFSSWNLFWVRGLPAGFVFLSLPISLPSTWGKNSNNHWYFIPYLAVQQNKCKTRALANNQSINK